MEFENDYVNSKSGGPDRRLSVPEPITDDESKKLIADHEHDPPPLSQSLNPQIIDKQEAAASARRKEAIDQITTVWDRLTGVSESKSDLTFTSDEVNNFKRPKTGKRLEDIQNGYLDRYGISDELFSDVLGVSSLAPWSAKEIREGVKILQGVVGVPESNQDGILGPDLIKNLYRHLKRFTTWDAVTFEGISSDKVKRVEAIKKIYALVYPSNTKTIKGKTNNGLVS